MANPSALVTLIELAVKDSDDAARRLGEALRAAEETEKKLEMLLGYRDEYASRFQSNQANGISAMEYRNFQLFIDKLDTAISGQQTIVDNARHRVDGERKSWQECERKRMSYDTLASRAETARQHKENKRDQKQMDEYAARSAMYKR
ncbi:flagellar export protein FliJ [Noviherbaspirillum sedimenti]|uniref:Flagellar FliJ protein n=1 Tax=Noviherbaspirillum sedimenti TaxID=2320865 RepID=A0A3A3FYA0_9BURK|nr:flagellar export protein FliJ [Noviherbaspirillum sedimenti]RJG01163.1 flagella biosynthesis chaperone FliJ [Noviherbaspirillum sedimenti]